MSLSGSAPLPSDAELEARIAAASGRDDALTLVELANKTAAVGRGAIADRLGQRAIDLATALGDASLRIRALRARARGVDETGDYAGEVRLLVEAQGLARHLGEAEQELQILSSLGMAYGQLGLRAESIAAHESALALSSRFGPLSEARCNGKLASTLITCERAVESVSYAARALELARESGDAEATLWAQVIHNGARASVAEWTLRRGDDRAARESLRPVLADCEATLAACRAAGLEGYAIPVMQNIAVIRKLVGDWAGARTLCDEVVALSRERGWKRVELYALLQVGALQSLAGEYAAAEATLHEVLGFHEAARNMTPMLDTLAELALLYERMGDPGRAYGQMKRQHRIRMELASSEGALRLQIRSWREENETLRRLAEEARSEADALAGRNEELAEQNRSLDHEARHDALTGLPNRRHGDAWIGQQFLEHVLRDGTMALAIVDIDHFKGINDRYSHVVGDSVLTEIAGILRATCRERDLAVRMGGDEFLLAFPDTTAAQADAICQRMLAQIDRHPWRLLGQGLRVTVTIGIADSTGAESVLDLLRTADSHLYEAKKAGRNRIA